MLIAAHIGFTGFRQLSTQFMTFPQMVAEPESRPAGQDPLAAIWDLSA